MFCLQLSQHPQFQALKEIFLIHRKSAQTVQTFKLGSNVDTDEKVCAGLFLVLHKRLKHIPHVLSTIYLYNIDQLHALKLPIGTLIDLCSIFNLFCHKFLKH